MKPERIRELHDDFRKALGRLKEAVDADMSQNSLVADAAIQRFEFTFELAWKLLRALLLHQGIQTNAPRSAIKEGFAAGLIRDGEGWIDMIEDRNRTSHVYDEKEAEKIFDKIRKNHINLLRELDQCKLPSCSTPV